jgi:hypothetical protein
VPALSELSDRARHQATAIVAQLFEGVREVSVVTATHPKRRRVLPAVVTVAALFLSLLVASPTHAATEPIIFTGQVQIESIGPAAAGQFEITARLSGQSAIAGSALTGADGRFSVTGLTDRGVYILTATPIDEPDLFPVSTSITAYESDLTRNVGTLLSRHLRTFSGTVVTPEGGNIPNDTTIVTVRNNVTGWSASSPVVDGRFSFSGLQPVAHQIEIDYTGSAGFYDRPATPTPNLTLGDVTNTRYKLSRGVSVTIELYGEASQPAPSDTIVTLYKWAETAWAQVDYSEISASPGEIGSDREITFLDLSPGDYLAHVAPTSATHPPFWIQGNATTPWPSYQYSDRDLSVLGSASLRITSAYSSPITVQRVIRSMRAISGLVLLPDGSPATDGVVRVTLVGPSDEGTRDLATELLDDGTFSFSGLVPWDYRLRVDYLPDDSVFDTTVNFEVTSAPQPSPATISLAHSYTITGTLSLGESSRVAPEGTRVEIVRSSCCQRLTATTDANGEFLFTGLVAGTYTVEVPDFGDASWIRANTRVVLAGNVDADLDIVLEQRRAFGGTVTNSSGTPLGGIHVIANLYHPPTGAYWSQMVTTTDSAGRYSFTPDHFDVEVYFFDPAGVYATTGWEDVNPYYVPDLLKLPANTHTTGIDARLQKAGRLTGTVATPGYTSVDRQYVEVEVMVYDEFTGQWARTGDYYGITSTGTFSIPDIYPDDYRIRAAYEGSTGSTSSRSGVVTVAPGQSRSVGTITLGTVAPRLAYPVSVGGEAAIGSTWYVESGEFSGVPAPTRQYRWLRCSRPVAAGLTVVPTGCVTITGATGSQYRTTRADSGYYITGMITATNAAGSTRAVAPTTIRTSLPPGAPANTVAPTVTGFSRLGFTWTLNPGTFTGTPSPTLKRAWYRCTAPVTTVGTEVPAGCVAISGATGTIYTSTRLDYGKYLIAVVTATNSLGSIRAVSRSTVRIGYGDLGVRALIT